MPKDITNIEYTKYGVNITGIEYDEEVLQLADGTSRTLRTNERGFAAPCGINDGKDIEAHVATIVGEAAAKPFAEIAVLQAERNAERQAKEQAAAERDIERKAKRQAEQAILAERAEKAILAEQLEKVRGEKDQLLQRPQRENDRGNAGRSE